jgi:hypothetical protein
VKKARKERKKARKEKRAREVAGATRESPAALEPSISSPPAGLRRATSKFSSPLRSLKFNKYSHTFKREHATASVILSADEKYNELTMKIRMLVSQAQKVDTTFVIEPAKEGDKRGRWEKSSEVPFNFTELGAAVKIADNARFEKVKPWGRRATNEDGTEADLIDPEVYFTFCFSCDKDPDELLADIRIECKRQGYNRLEMKPLDCFDTKTALVIYYLHNEGSQRTLIKEMSKFLKEGRDLEAKLAVASGNEYTRANTPIPMMVMRTMMPKVPGLDTTAYANWHWSEAEKRKALHVETSSEDVKTIQEFVTTAKKHQLVNKYWGDEVRLSNVIIKAKKNRRRGDDEEDTSQLMLDKFRSYCIGHIDYQASMTYKGLDGAFDVDRTVNVYSVTDISKVVGTINLRIVLYSMKMLDGRPLFAEIHQSAPLMNVDVVIGKTKEATDRVEMMNKNIAAYVHFNFPIEGVGEDLIERLLKISVDPELIKDIGKCKWDKKKLALTTPKDAEEANKKKLEEAAWYQKDYGVKLSTGGKKPWQKEEIMAPENVFTLGDDHTYKTLDERVGTYAGSPGAATLDLGRSKMKPARVDVEDNDDEVSVMSNGTNYTNMTEPEEYTKEELCGMLREMRMSRRSPKRGSAPHEIEKPHHKTTEAEESVSSGDSSSVSSSSDEEEDSVHDAADSG